MSWFITQTLAGNGFFGTGPVAGIAIPIQSTTTCRFCLWNPAGSGVNLVLNKLLFTKVDAADPGVGGYLLGLLPNAGNVPATAAPVATFTAITPTNCKIGNGPISKARFASAATGTTITAATTLFYSLGLSRETVTDTVGPVNLVHDFGGSVVLGQGTFAHLVGIAADTQVSMPTISWAEVPA